MGLYGFVWSVFFIIIMVYMARVWGDGHHKNKGFKQRGKPFEQLRTTLIGFNFLFTQIGEIMYNVGPPPVISWFNNPITVTIAGWWFKPS